MGDGEAGHLALFVLSIMAGADSLSLSHTSALIHYLFYNWLHLYYFTPKIIIIVATTHSAISKHLDVEELEMLLEAYFVQIDGTLNKLSTVYHLHLPLYYCHLCYHLIVWTRFSLMLKELDSIY